METFSVVLQQPGSRNKVSSSCTWLLDSPSQDSLPYKLFNTAHTAANSVLLAQLGTKGGKFQPLQSLAFVFDSYSREQICLV